MRVRVLPRAERDLVEIDAWLTRESPQTVTKVMRGLLDGLEQLESLPYSGPIVRDPWLASRGFRVLSRGRYAIFFKIHRLTVVIYRVLHQRREWSRLT